jgi:hypothetical protein
LKRTAIGVCPIAFGTYSFFDWLINVIRIRCLGGAGEQDGVELVLD